MSTKKEVEQTKTQGFCGECGATDALKYCIKNKKKTGGRIIVVGKNKVPSETPIELCETRLEILNRRDIR